MATPVANLIGRFGKDAEKPGEPRSETNAEVMTDRAKQRATNGAADSGRQNDIFHGRRGKKAASY